MKTVFHYFLAFAMLVTGSINTISTKYADNTYADGVSDNDPQRQFNHPFVQAVGMFFGEMLCFLFYGIQKLTRRNKPSEPQTPFNPLIFLPAAMCDMTATSLMYVGLTMTYASSFQMLRGAVIVFTGILSVLFLRRKLRLFHWAGMLLVVVGVTIVGLASVLFAKSSTKPKNPLVGDLIIVGAQVIVAVQMVWEEKFISKYNVTPLKAVGWEGVFGFTVLSILLVPMYYIPGSSPGNRLENVIDAAYQFKNSGALRLFLFGNILSIAFFNWSGIAVTVHMNATTRMVLDSLRTLTVWMWGLFAVSNGKKWNTFQPLQLVGFVVLFIGMCVYNDIIIRPGLKALGLPVWKPAAVEAPEEEKTPFLQVNDIPDENDGTAIVNVS